MILMGEKQVNYLEKIREAFAVYFSSYANAFTSARDEEDKMGGEWRNEDEAG